MKDLIWWAAPLLTFVGLLIGPTFLHWMREKVAGSSHILAFVPLVILLALFSPIALGGGLSFTLVATSWFGEIGYAIGYVLFFVSAGVCLWIGVLLMQRRKNFARLARAK